MQGQEDTGRAAPQDDETVPAPEGRTNEVSPAGGLVDAVDRAQTVLGRLGVAALLFFVLALLFAREAAPFIGMLAVVFFALYILTLFVTVFAGRGRGGAAGRRGPEARRPDGESGHAGGQPEDARP